MSFEHRLSENRKLNKVELSLQIVSSVLCRTEREPVRVASGLSRNLTSAEMHNDQLGSNSVTK